VRFYRSFGDLPLGGPRRAVAIGTFDGVHVGHQAIISRAIELGRDRGLPAMVVTFEPNPTSVLRPELRTTVLTPVNFKAQLIERLGADELLVVPFTRAFARIRAERFAEMLVSAPLGADALVVGDNFRFGYGGAGTVDMLRHFGRGHGMALETPALVTSADGKPISSTRVRRLVATGHVAQVTPLLGRPHTVEGVVMPGDGRGRGMGLATANVEPPPDAAVPARGIYAGRVTRAAGRSAAAISVGTSPTFTAGQPRPPVRIEAHLLDHDGTDLYGETVRVEFIERLRDEVRYDSVEALMEQVRDDIARTRSIVAYAADGGAPAT
jgi:riboflavin kinase / FMN adenylyltransferase